MTPQEHRSYYAQRLDPGIKLGVERLIGKTRIVESTCKYLNDIPIRHWDTAAIALVSIGSLSQKVCTCKEAAKQIREEYYANNS